MIGVPLLTPVFAAKSICGADVLTTPGGNMPCTGTFGTVQAKLGVGAPPPTLVVFTLPELVGVQMPALHDFGTQRTCPHPSTSQ